MHYIFIYYTYIFSWIFPYVTKSYASLAHIRKYIARSIIYSALLCCVVDRLKYLYTDDIVLYMLLKVCLLLLDYYFALRCRIFFVSLVDALSICGRSFIFRIPLIIRKLLAHFITKLRIFFQNTDRFVIVFLGIHLKMF